ncbi:hypothetical protein BCS94_04010 [Vibrio breoganii]|uniref:hypothetical protein n=1 Tax=Vibrio breoganii TaxID=553239 RepID=UPI000C83FA30|nr:hypothetical protein [Vibrio breoganii]PMP10755.1 hypothetical protein BCS94_04010 [Vibrio breoganii]
MKYKVIALAVSGALLAACGSDNDNYVEPTATPVQAFDGAVRYLDTYIECNGGGFEYVGETGGNGILNIGVGNFPLFDEDPSQCVLEFGENIYGSGGGTREARDESNGKLMTNVRYLVPPQLLASGDAIAATPYTTLVALKIFEAEDAGETVDLDAIIAETFSETLPDGTTLTPAQQEQFLSNPQAVLDSLDATNSKNLQASTMVLSDAIASQQDNIAAGTVDSSALETATKKSAEVLAQDPDFPTTVNDDGETVPTYVDMTTEFDNNFDTISDPDNKDPVTVPPPEEGEELEPIDEEVLPPPTGGTGGTAG